MKKAIFSVALISVFASNAKAQDLKSIFGTIKKEVEKVNTQTSTTNKTTSTKQPAAKVDSVKITSLLFFRILLAVWWQRIIIYSAAEN